MSSGPSVHATCVAWDDRAVLIRGPSGAGKSALGLTLMAYGCALVADDRVHLTGADGHVIATTPPQIAGLIEARGVGLLHAVHTAAARIVLVVDLSQTQQDRLPDQQSVTLLGCDIPLIYQANAPHFAPAILQILKAGLHDQ